MNRSLFILNVASSALTAACSQSLDAPSRRCSALADPECRDAGVDVDVDHDVESSETRCTSTVALISEVLFDPDGPDSGAEFVELAGPPLAELEGLRIEGFDGASVSTRWSMDLAGRFDGKGMFVIGGEAVAAATASLSRSLEQGPDALILRGCDDELLDAVAWGDWEEDRPMLEGAVLAGPSESGESVARCATFDRLSPLMAGPPSPGLPDAPGLCAEEELDAQPSCSPTTWNNVRISELFADPEGADRSAAEFIELSGPAGTSLSGLMMRAVNGANGEPYGEVPLEGSISERGLFVLGGADVTPDQSWDLSLQNGPDAVELIACDRFVVDALAYGGSSEAMGEGAAAEAAGPGLSLHRCGPDSDDNMEDFREGPSTPGERSPHELCAPSDVEEDEPACATSTSVRIHEILYDPEGADDPGAEFIELLGEPNAVLGGARLILRNGANGDVYGDFSLPDLQFSEDGVVLLGGPMPLPIPMQNGPDVVEVLDCSEALLDRVAYGGRSEAMRDLDRLRGPIDAVGGSGASLAACDGDPEVWFPGHPTPGSDNRPIEGHSGCDIPACRPMPPGAVLLHDVHYDPEGADKDAEFVTLWSALDERVEGLELLAINGRDGEVYDSTGRFGADFGPDGFWVLGGAEVELSDARLSIALQNGPDSLILLDCGDGVQDALAYGEFEDAVATGEGAPAFACPAGETLSRRDTGADTDDNQSDFACEGRSEPVR